MKKFKPRIAKRGNAAEPEAPLKIDASRFKATSENGWLRFWKEWVFE
jgi:hypothetical protein